MPRIARILAFVVSLASWPAGLFAAPPVDVGALMYLDRPGFVGIGGREACASGNANGLIALCWLASPGVVHVRVYDVAGSPRTPVVEATRQAAEARLAVDLGEDGGFVVAWPQVEDAAQGPALRARRYRPDGTPDSSEIVVAPSMLTGSLYRPFVIDLADDGSLFAVWQMARSSTHVRLAVRAFDRIGQPRAAEGTVAEGTDPGFFAGLALGVRGDQVVVAYGKPRLDQASRSYLSDVRARRFHRAGSPTSSEIGSGLPMDPTISHVPTGAILFADGRFGVVFQPCDPLNVSGVCGAPVTLWVGPDDVPGRVSPTPAPPVLAPATASGPQADDLENFGTLVIDPTRNGRLTVTNPLGALVATATIPPPPASGRDFGFAGFVPVGIGRFALIWHDGDWTYLQALTVGGEITAAPYFHSIEPCRLVDTRGSGVPLRATNDVAIDAAGRCAVPIGGKALAANVTSVASTAPGDVRLYRADGLVPETSVLNYAAGQVRAGFTIVPLDGLGRFGARASQAGGTTHLIVDVTGYFE